MLLIFIFAFLFSFLGSIPPGSINLSILQLALDSRVKAALRFALASALVEFPYAYVAVQFESFVTSSIGLTDNFQLIAAVVMLTLGVLNIISHFRGSKNTLHEKLNKSGFRKGVLISILNPLAIPFWIGVTAYLKHQGWIELLDTTDVIIYVSGISCGTFTLLALLALLATRVSHFFKKNGLIDLLPGVVFMLLGFYALAQYLRLV
ncbi:hypothetical protein FNH22_25645 [Fulvivirga sp. M361]|uniref:LysE family translocator n=1 Tax=Fulvivirga sp. M361 TaxID=2594266 RepID=UPI00117BC049|nr:LysE family transporter [Fulvivirga sp. M361]TRX50428.1 hypothetical protein FNH22_25645 [Fulvivirga sp. M361]